MEYTGPNGTVLPPHFGPSLEEIQKEAKREWWMVPMIWDSETFENKNKE